MENKLAFKLTSTCPLLMHADTTVNPFHPLTRAIKKLTSKKTKKTDEDLEEIYRLEWEAGLYFDEKVGPYLPGYNIQCSMRDAARFTRQGKSVERGIVVMEDMIPLEYKGPRTIEELYADNRFIDIRSVRVGAGSRTTRARPRFNTWTAKFRLFYDASEMNKEDIVSFLKVAGMKSCTGDFRPRFGRFESEEIDVWEDKK